MGNFFYSFFRHLSSSSYIKNPERTYAISSCTYNDIDKEKKTLKECNLGTIPCLKGKENIITRKAL